MARAKKGAALTPEERLQAALVPDWEWPYKLPENWCWTRIGMVSNFERGITFPAAAKEAAPTEDNIPCLRTANVQENLEIDDMIYVNRDFMKGNIAKLVRENDIIMSSANSRELVGKSSLVTHIPFPMTFGGFVLNIRAKEMSSKYLFYFLRHEFLAGKFIGESSQTTNIANINTTTLGNYEIPLPPLPEQQRIVDRIESLFAKLDEAKEKAQAVVDSFETRKAAILHKAFTGELTAKWREEHGVGMDSWRWIPLKKSGSWYGGGTPSMSRSEYWENGTLLWVTAKDMKSDLIEDTLMHTNMFGVENSSANYIAQPAVLFVMRSGILRRTFPVCMVKKPFTVNQDIKALVPTDNIDLEYLFWGCKANEKRILESCMKNGTTVESINSAALRDFEIPIAGSNEQIEIVRILDAFFAKEQQTKEAAEKVLDQIELMKKSILARAFRGELGTNDPSEESAVGLLKRTIL